jgi:ribosomal protein S18 acetylase RimI-like enzyme
LAGGQLVTAATATAWQTRSVADREEVAAFLRTDRLYAAYALGDLDAASRKRASWGIAYAGGRPRGLAMQHLGLPPQPLFLMGYPEACRAVLATEVRPRYAFVQARHDLASAFSDLYKVDLPASLLRMVVDRDTFRPLAGGAARLAPADIGDLNRLYQLGLGGGFPASILEDGVYYGVRVGGRLVAAAGTHVINEREGIAVVGNVLTHVDHRGQGHAKAVTAGVTAELLTRVADVALNVYAENEPAVAAYARLGYREYCRLGEWVAYRRTGGWDLIRPLREALRWSWPRADR